MILFMADKASIMSVFFEPLAAAVRTHEELKNHRTAGALSGFICVISVIIFLKDIRKCIPALMDQI